MQPNNESNTASLPPSVVQAAMRKKEAGTTVHVTLTESQVEAFSAAETGEEHVDTVTAAELRQFIERVERLEEEKSDIGADIKGVMGEAKGRGYDTKAIRKIIKMRKQDTNTRMNEEAILHAYMLALGME